MPGNIYNCKYDVQTNMEQKQIKTVDAYVVKGTHQQMLRFTFNDSYWEKPASVVVIPYEVFLETTGLELKYMHFLEYTNMCGNFKFKEKITIPSMWGPGQYNLFELEGDFVFDYKAIVKNFDSNFESAMKPFLLIKDAFFFEHKDITLVAYVTDEVTYCFEWEKLITFMNWEEKDKVDLIGSFIDPWRADDFNDLNEVLPENCVLLETAEFIYTKPIGDLRKMNNGYYKNMYIDDNKTFANTVIYSAPQHLPDYNPWPSEQSQNIVDDVYDGDWHNWFGQHGG